MSEQEFEVTDDSRNGEQIDEWTTTVDGTEYECSTDIFYAYFGGYDNLEEYTWQLTSEIVCGNGLHSDANFSYMNSRLREYDDLDSYGSSHRTDDGDVGYTFIFTTTDVEYVREVTSEAARVLDELFSEYGTSYEEQRTFEEGDILRFENIPDDDSHGPEWVDETRIGAKYDDAYVTFECKDVEVVDVTHEDDV